MEPFAAEVDALTVHALLAAEVDELTILLHPRAVT